MWHKINIQRIFVERISEQTHLSSALFVKNSVVTLELYQICTSSGLNLIRLSFNCVQAKRWGESEMEREREGGRGMEEGRERQHGFFKEFIVFTPACLPFTANEFHKKRNCKVRHHRFSETDATRVL